MTAENWIQLQDELVWAFGPMAIWWLVLLLVALLLMAVLLFALQTVGQWLERNA